MVNQTHDSTGKTNASNDQNRKIFLGGLSYYTTEETLRQYCGRFGQFTDCVVMRNPEGKSRGFGFVTYEDEQSVEQFMQARPHNIDSRQIDPKRAMPREDQNSTEAHLSVKKLFVAGLRDGIDENALREYFNGFGNVTEVLVMKDREGKHRGFAFVSFDDYDAVDKAILGKPHMINGRPLDIKKAIPKDKMHDMSRPPPSSNRYSMAPPSHRNQNYDQGPYPPQWGNPNGGHGGPPPPSYPSQGYNSSMNSDPYSSPYASNMNPPSSMMNYDSYGNNNSANNNSAMPYSSNPSNNYMPPMSSSSYGANQSSSYGQMNMPYPPSASSGSVPPPPPSSGYNDGTSSAGAPNSYGNNNNNNNYGMMSQSYSGNYSQMPSGPSRGGGGAMRGSRGGYAGNNFNSRPAPYSTRGGGGGRGGGRGRGRGQ